MTGYEMAAATNTVALLALLRAKRGEPALARWFYIAVPGMLELAKESRPEDADAFGAAVRFLRGHGIMVDEVGPSGLSEWRLGVDDPQMNTTGWPDDLAREMVR